MLSAIIILISTGPLVYWVSRTRILWHRSHDEIHETLEDDLLLVPHVLVAAAVGLHAADPVGRVGAYYPVPSPPAFLESRCPILYSMSSALVISDTCGDFGGGGFFTVVKLGGSFEPPAASALASASAVGYLSAVSSSSRSNARSIPSGVGCRYRCDTVTLLCPAILMIVKASAPAPPNRVNMVCPNECITKSAGSFRAVLTASCWWSRNVPRIGESGFRGATSPACLTRV